MPSPTFTCPLFLQSPRAIVPVMATAIVIIVALLLSFSAHSDSTCWNAPLETHITEYVHSGRDVELCFQDRPNTKNPYRIHVWSPQSNIDYPIIVVVKQQRSVTSWQVPLLVETSDGMKVQFHNTSRTLCYDTNEIVKKYHTKFRMFNVPILNKRNFTISLSSSSQSPVEVYVYVDVFDDYFLRTNKRYSVSVSPSEPVYYSYDFPPNRNKTPQTVLVHITSNDSTCLIASVQSKVCPVRELNSEITYEGRYQTITTKGGLAISNYKYPDGFILVFVAKGDNAACTPGGAFLPVPEASPYRTIQSTTVEFEVRTGRTAADYLVATMVVFWSTFAVCLFFMVLTVCFYHCGRYKDVPEEEDSTDRILELADDEMDAYFKKTELKVSDFMRRGRLNGKKSLNYFWHIVNVAIFYGIPVVQLMISYQRSVDTSGNLDLCYHNFHCAQPFYFTDFSHIFSNVGYMLFGFLFLLVTRYRSTRIRNYPGSGIPKFNGLYYAMGIALVFEGVLSGCYHICPNQSNFQFDTSFMYAMAVLIMIKLYQNRHPDINASAYATFFILGIAVSVAMFGILYNSIAIMVVFIVCYIYLCVYVGFKIYFFGNVYRGLRMMNKARLANEPVLELIRPVRIGRFALLILANLCNIAIAIAGLVVYPSVVDFGTFLLGILMTNAIMYCAFYMIMKLVCGERVCYEAIMYGLLGLVFWIFGAYFFVSGVTQWNATPAESRALNQECILLGFFDTHDVWHLLSAPALFFSFMFLQTLDDDLYDKPQSDIHAF